MTDDDTNGPIKPTDYFIKYLTDEGEPFFSSISTEETCWDIPEGGLLGKFMCVYYITCKDVHAFIHIYAYTLIRAYS